MGKLLSVHTTPIYYTIMIVPHLIIGLCMMTVGIAGLHLGAFVFGAFFFFVAALNFGLPGKPAYRLEIYEEGMVYCTFWRTQTWRWSEFGSIRSMWFGPWGSRKNFLQLTDASGRKIPLNVLSNWEEAHKRIVGNVTAALHEKFATVIRQGDDLTLSYSLRVNSRGLVYRGRFVPW